MNTKFAVSSCKLISSDSIQSCCELHVIKRRNKSSFVVTNHFAWLTIFPSSSVAFSVALTGAVRLDAWMNLFSAPMLLTFSSCLAFANPHLSLFLTCIVADAQFYVPIAILRRISSFILYFVWNQLLCILIRIVS